jgi:hypothetical protein
MNDRELEKQIEELERALRAADGSSYSLVTITLGVQAKRPPDAMYREWLGECNVIAEDLTSSINRFGSKVPLIIFAKNRVPPNDWVLVNGLQTISAESVGGGHKWWIHPIVNQRYKEWLKTCN